MILHKSSLKGHLKTIAVVFILMATSISTFAQLGTGTRTAFQFMHQSKLRKFNVYVPNSYNPSVAVPLVVCLHPGNPYSDTMNLNMERYTHFDLVADTANFILVFPNGTDQPYGTWEDDNQYGVDDIGFLKRMVDTVKKHYNINNNNKFMTGFSRGAFMTYTMACTNSSLFKAIAPVSGQKVHSMNCTPTAQVPVFHIHGDNDNDAVYQGSFDPPNNTDSVRYVLNLWAINNNCNPVPQITNLPDVVTTDNCSISKLYFAPNTGGKEVIHFRVNNGGHFWPGSKMGHLAEGFTGSKNMDIDATVEIWRFFRKYCDVTATNVKNPRPVEHNIVLYPNPSSDLITVQSYDAIIKSVVITNIEGKVMLQEQNNANKYSLNISSFSKGVYFVTVNANQHFKFAKK